MRIEGDAGRLSHRKGGRSDTQRIARTCPPADLAARFPIPGNFSSTQTRTADPVHGSGHGERRRATAIGMEAIGGCEPPSFEVAER